MKKIPFVKMCFEFNYFFINILLTMFGLYVSEQRNLIFLILTWLSCCYRVSSGRLFLHIATAHLFCSLFLCVRLNELVFMFALWA